jgi:ribose transport system substrate-binding protein
MKEEGMKTKSGRRLAVAACVAAGLTIAACGATSDDKGSGSGSGSGGSSAINAAKLGIPTGQAEMVDTKKWKKSPPWTIGYADASQSNSWRVFAWQYMQYGASQLPNTKLIHTNANDSTSKQVSDIEDLLNRNVDCLIVGSLAEKALSPVISQASKRVPVVISEGRVSTPDYVSFASLDEVNMGELQAEGVAKLLGGKGNVVILQGVAGSGPVQQDLQGMKNVLAKYPKIKVLTTQYTDWSRDKGKSVMENALQAFPKIDAVLSDSGLQNNGAFEAVKAAGRLKEIKAWSADSDQSFLRVINENKLPAIVVNRPTQVAENAIKLCGAILSGQSVPKEWKTPNQVIESEQLGKYIADSSIAGSGQWWDWWNLPKQWLPKQG